MYKEIESADLVKYNANNRGKNSPDCVKRSISLAFDIDYSEAAKLLNAEMKNQHRSKWNIKPVFNKVIKDLNGSEQIKTTEKETVEEFADNNPKGTYIILCGKENASNKTSHMVCIIDGKIYDSWDCRDYIVDSYYIVTDSKPITDISNEIANIAWEVVEPTITDEIDKFIQRKNLNINYKEVYTTNTREYKIKVQCKVIFDTEDWISKRRTYNFEIVIPIAPTATYDKAVSKAKEVAKIRTYDRMYAIVQQEKKLKEEQEVVSQIGEPYNINHLFMDGREEKFFNSLPGWAKPLVTYLNINQPGSWHDSYQLYLDPLPGHRSAGGKVIFEAYNAADIKDMLRRYRDKDEVPGMDYDIFEEY